MPPIGQADQGGTVERSFSPLTQVGGVFLFPPVPAAFRRCQGARYIVSLFRQMEESVMMVQQMKLIYINKLNFLANNQVFICSHFLKTVDFFIYLLYNNTLNLRERSILI